MSKRLIHKLAALNPWLDGVDPGDLGAVAQAAGTANADRLAQGAAAWSPWAGDMSALSLGVSDPAERALFDAAARTDLSAAVEPLDLFAIVFPGALRVADRALRNLTVESCLIGGDLELEDLSIDRGLSLQSTAVSGRLRLARSRLDGRIDFAGLRVGGEAAFEDVVFEGGVWHQKAVFSGAARWVGVDFKSDAAFHTAEFVGPTRFERVNFCDTTSFEKTRFGSEGTSDAVAFYKKCFTTGATGALPKFLEQPDAPKGGADNVRQLPTRGRRPDRKDAG